MQWDAITNRARTDLAIRTEQGEEDLYLWEHSVRVLHSSRQIGRFAAVRADSPPDEEAIGAAALYHDAGWAVSVRDGDIKRGEVFCRSRPESHRAQGASLLERSLVGLLARESIARAVAIIRALDDREIETLEGQVVREADNLEEFGVLTLWSTIRRGALEGKGVQAVLDTWRRRKEYRFWEARLTDSFRFPPVRAVAERRLVQLERLMDTLADQQDGADLEAVLRQMLGGQSGKVSSALSAVE